MRTANSILAVLLLSWTLNAQPAPRESQLLGTWVSVQRSLGALGSMCTFLPGHKMEMSFGAVVEGWYRVEGDKLIQPPGKTNGEPTVTRFQVKGDTLYQRPEKGNTEMRLLRVGKAEAREAPIVGVWRPELQTTARSIMEEQRKAGHEVDAMTAEGMAYIANHRFQEYTRDGLIKLRIPMRTTAGTYDTSSQTFVLEGETKQTGRFRLQDGLLVLTQPNGKTEETYIRADATKEQLKRAGVRYGNKPAELDPPVR
jgi:hypothetical protein